MPWGLCYIKDPKNKTNKSPKHCNQQKQMGQCPSNGGITKVCGRA